VHATPRRLSATCGWWMEPPVTDEPNPPSPSCAACYRRVVPWIRTLSVHRVSVGIQHRRWGGLYVASQVDAQARSALRQRLPSRAGGARVRSTDGMDLA